MKFKINSIEWTISEHIKNSPLLQHENEPCLGICHFWKKRICLYVNLKRDVKRQVLIHELTHAFLGETQVGENNAFTEEHIGDFMAMYSLMINKIADDYFKTRSAPHPPKKCEATAVIDKFSGKYSYKAKVHIDKSYCDNPDCRGYMCFPCENHELDEHPCLREGERAKRIVKPAKKEIKWHWNKSWGRM
ncbi:MAG: hypothetical protein FWD49_01875 [Firmicutes bacterium]|nr:hypothetical protein [Bacillota bacterium]